MQRSGRSLSALLIVVGLVFSACAGEKSLVKKTPAPLTTGEIGSKISSVYPELELCYHQSLKNRDIFYGKALLVIWIAKDGGVKRITWKPMPSSKFLECTRDVIMKLNFRKLPDDVRIEIPVNFTLEMEEKK